MTVIQNITTGLPNPKSASQVLEGVKLIALSGGGYNSSASIDKVDIKHASFADPSNHVRTLDAGSGQKAHFVFSEKTSEVSAVLVNKDGASRMVASENLPKDIKNIKTLDSFNGFLENAQVRGTVLSDGEAKLYVTQKGLGGSGKQGFFGGGRAGGGTANGNWMQNLSQVPSAPMPHTSGASVYGNLGASSAQHAVGAAASVGAGISGPGGVVGLAVSQSQGFPTNGMNPSKPSTDFTAGFRFNF